MPLLGEHQILNACVAVATLHSIQQQGIDISTDALRRGLSQVNWPGRLEILNRRPLLVVDGAHNGESCRRLAEALRQEPFRYRRLYLIFGASSDKDHPAMLRGLLSLHPKIILTRADHPRAADPHNLHEIVETLKAKAEIIPTVTESLEWALDHAAPDDLICATGSLFIVADMRRAWYARSGRELPCDPVTS